MSETGGFSKYERLWELTGGQRLRYLAAIAAMGIGNVFLFGPEINFRAQPHGTFKLLFNGIYADTESSGGSRD